MDVVRAFYRALNADDVDAMAALYAADCVVEHVFDGDDGVYEGRTGVVERWASEVAARRGALAGGGRVDVSRIAGIETGWGWVRAEWRTAAADRDGASAGLARAASGYSHFWVENGLIRRHRSIWRRGDDGQNDLGGRFPAGQATTTPEVGLPSGPARPVVGVGAVVLTDEGQVVLVKRRHEPLAGQWSLPGGALELGETLEAGAAREILEETGLVVEVGPVVEVFDRILLDDDGRVRFHFVLVDYLCRPRGGRLQAGSDVEAVMLADPDGLGACRVTEKARSVVARAVEMQRDR